MIARASAQHSRAVAARTALLALIVGVSALTGCGPLEKQGRSPDLVALRSDLAASDQSVTSVRADYTENDLGQGTLKVTLIANQDGDAEKIAEDAVKQIWTRWITDRVRIIDVIVLGTEDVSYTVQRRYTLPGQADELVEKYGPSATPG